MHVHIQDCIFDSNSISQITTISHVDNCLVENQGLWESLVGDYYCCMPIKDKSRFQILVIATLSLSELSLHL